MNRNAKTAFCFLSLSIFMTAVAIAQVTVDEEKLREFVIQTMKENPKLVYELYNDYARQLRAEKEKKQLEASFANRIEDAVSEANPVKGPSDAPITIVEYSDYQCPYCARGANTMKRILELYPGKVRLAFKNNPLDFHEEAVAAAKAALAAGKQGKFWEYHDLLFENSKELKENLYVSLASDLGLDMEKFHADRNSEQIASQVESERNRAAELNLKGTPSFLVNGVVVRGAKPLSYFQTVIDRLLEETEAKTGGK